MSCVDAYFGLFGMCLVVQSDTYNQWRLVNRAKKLEYITVNFKCGGAGSGKIHLGCFHNILRFLQRLH